MSLTVARTLKIGAISAGMWMALAGYLFLKRLMRLLCLRPLRQNRHL